ncbi:uncharacterized protein CANTADRAFT_88689 [Suhomyces tanzawaensis NRRL Y-17324]|uniref:Uncharacterized protein n=1 Tax=Suhomyces tanzawaensis NRRL Y-17324 TaxID=984487 RepID=A0A1E4SMN5_9ASCO|nr:uncharacterized protein CANTADRAFT_88689 [Suhomyces tanzawaensis NRRL Y-17324]ODV80780.1 hypothetical protein CANTADRAFT_88689 [Suhomyces tanzawaensis NRRL Y-17324]
MNFRKKGELRVTEQQISMAGNSNGSHHQRYKHLSNSPSVTNYLYLVKNRNDTSFVL